MPRQPRYQSLDFWRGVACLFVVIFHSTSLQNSYQERDHAAGPSSGFAAAVFAGMRWLWLGVPMFFVISGYCIAATADATRRRPQALKTYFFRRFRRIYPPFWVAFALAALAVIALDCFLMPGVYSRAPDPMVRPWWLSGWQFLGNLSLTETWRHHLLGGERGYLLGQAWTLCYEEQFYAATGILLLFSTRHFFKLATALTILCLATTFGARWLHLSIEGFFLDGHWLLFAAGILVYYQINYASRRQRGCITIFLILCFLFSLFGPPLIIDCGPTEIDRVRVAFGFAVLISLLQPLDGWICSRPWLRPLVFCGTICYSLYLIHVPVVRALSHTFYRLGIRDVTGTLLITVPVCVMSSLVFAWIFHVFVERRFLNPPHAATTPIADRKRVHAVLEAS